MRLLAIRLADGRSCWRDNCRRLRQTDSVDGYCRRIVTKSPIVSHWLPRFKSRFEKTFCLLKKREYKKNHKGLCAAATDGTLWIEYEDVKFVTWFSDFDSKAPISNASSILLRFLCFLDHSSGIGFHSLPSFFTAHCQWVIGSLSSFSPQFSSALISSVLLSSPHLSSILSQKPNSISSSQHLRSSFSSPFLEQTWYLRPSDAMFGNDDLKYLSVSLWVFFLPSVSLWVFFLPSVSFSPRPAPDTSTRNH